MIRPSHTPSVTSWIGLLATLLLMGGLVELGLWRYNQYRDQEEQRFLRAQGYEMRAVLLAELNATLHLASGLASYIPTKQGRLDATELQPWLRGLFAQGRYIRNIGLAPDNRIAYLYPLEGNESALGLYYPDFAEQWPRVQHIIANRAPQLDGPLNLVQGGRGLVYRVPVYLQDQRYWGLISTVIDHDRIMAYLDALARQRDLAIDLLPFDAPAAASAGNVRLPVSLAGAKWQLQVSSTSQPLVALTLARALGWSLALLITCLAAWMMHLHRRRASLAQALNRSQQDFMRAFDLAPQGMAMLKATGQLLEVNQALCQILERSREELVGAVLADFCLPSDRELLRQHLVQESGQARRGWWIRLLDAEQNPVDVECSASWLGQSVTGEALCILHIQDITERLRLQQMQREFIASVSHELRTPLTSITGSLGLINGGALGEVPPAMQSLLQIAQSNSSRLHELINDLLDMEKLMAGKMRYDISEQPIWPLLEDAITHNQPYADQYQVALELVGHPVEVNVAFDSQRLAQILANLISNAVKFSPPGSVVTLKASVDHDWLRVSVRDRGIGIKDEFKSRIFSRFSQADAGDARQKGGTGLGLAICKELIEAMSGRIGYESREHLGSTFWFELPIVSQVVKE
ncbi:MULTISPECIES: ATP-binding protein [Pseudomonadales]|uniref:ATP-binding protein n=1 Tax=Pseudomonadales TaxID=72274 RepID=UPI00068ACC52